MTEKKPRRKSRRFEFGTPARLELEARVARIVARACRIQGLNHAPSETVLRNMVNRGDLRLPTADDPVQLVTVVFGDAEGAHGYERFKKAVEDVWRPSVEDIFDLPLTAENMEFMEAELARRYGPARPDSLGTAKSPVRRGIAEAHLHQRDPAMRWTKERILVDLTRLVIDRGLRLPLTVNTVERLRQEELSPSYNVIRSKFADSDGKNGGPNFQRTLAESVAEALGTSADRTPVNELD